MADFDMATLQDILKDIKQLSSPNRSVQNPVNTPSTPGAIGTPQAPVKASWKSSGGFDPVSMRPNGRKGHMGLDLRAPGGTSVYPFNDGLVTSVGTDPLGGNVVNIQHSDGLRSYYAHLGTVTVQKGQKVDKNTVIGTIGDTGNAKGTMPHLHFEVRRGNTPLNPASYFSVPNYQPATKDEAQWLPGHREIAQNWNMQKHLQQKRVAFTESVDNLVKLCNKYYDLTRE